MAVLSPQALVTVVVLLAMVGNAEGIIEHKTRQLQPKEYVTMDWFGFLKGGQVTLSVSASNNTICETNRAEKYFWVMLCDIETLHSLNSKFVSIDQLCSSPSLANLICPVTSKLGCYYPEQTEDMKLNLAYSGTIRYSSVFFLTLLHCGTDGVFDIEADYVFLNPGNNHLGTEHRHLPYIYSAFILIWLIPAGAVLWSLWSFRDHPHVKLTQVICAPVATKFIVLIFSAAYWFILMRDGYLDPAMDLGYAFSIGLFKSALFYYLLVVAKGWVVVFDQLEPPEWRAVWFYTIGTLANSFLQSLFSSSQILMIVLFFLFVIILRGVIVSSAQTVRDLQMNRAMLLIYNPNQEGAVFKIIKRYRSFQTTFIAWLALDIMTKTMAYFLFLYSPWVVKLDEEILDLALLLGVGLAFKARWDANPSAQEDQLDGMALMGTEMSEMGADGDSSRERLGLEGSRAGPPSFMVVQNPPTKDERGILRPSVAVAVVAKSRKEKGSKREGGRDITAERSEAGDSYQFVDSDQDVENGHGGTVGDDEPRMRGRTNSRAALLSNVAT